MLSYREMTAEDVPAVLAVRFATRENAITLEELAEDYGITPASIVESLRGSDVRGWLCTAAGAVIGFAMGDRSSGEVLVVATLPDYEGRGIGKTLLARVCDWLFAEGHDEIWLGANPDPAVRATGFYRKLGWRRSGVMKGDDEVLRLRRRDFSAP
jgi:ribosomal protein S18 acetylase RimI-like enzyme